MFKPVRKSASGRRYGCRSLWDRRVAPALLSRADALVQEVLVVEARGGRRREEAEDKGSRPTSPPDTWGWQTTGSRYLHLHLDIAR